MIKVARRIVEPLRGERGATAVEYGLMVALIVLVIFATILQFGPTLRDTFNEVASSL